MANLPPPYKKEWCSAVKLDDGLWHYQVIEKDGTGIRGPSLQGYKTEKEAVEAINLLPPPCKCQWRIAAQKAGGSKVDELSRKTCPRHGPNPDPRVANLPKMVPLRKKYRK